MSRMFVLILLNVSSAIFKFTKFIPTKTLLETLCIVGSMNKELTEMHYGLLSGNLQNLTSKERLAQFTHYRMGTYKMQKKFKFCIDTRYFECTVYWFDIEHVMKHVNKHRLQY